MFTSDFTLEIRAPAALNIPPEAMPAQLQRLKVPESAWTSIYNYAAGLAKRMEARETAKKELDASNSPGGFSSVSLGLSKKRQKSKAEIDAQKAEHDKNTTTEWNALVNKCNAGLAGYGLSARLLHNPKTSSSEFGVEFRCDATKLGPNKLELRFDPRRGDWTWPRQDVPEELASFHVDLQSWMKVWDEANATLKRVIVLEKKKREAQAKINQVDSGISALAGNWHDRAAVSEAIRYSSKLVEDKFIASQDQELEWSKLLDSVEDIMFMWGVNGRLMRHECAKNLGHCGLVLLRWPLSGVIFELSSGEGSLRRSGIGVTTGHSGIAGLN